MLSKRPWVWLLVLLIACGERPTRMERAPVLPLDVRYRDGIYRAEYDAYDSLGWKPFLEVQIRGGRVVSAQYEEINPAGDYKSRNQRYTDLMRAQTGNSPLEVMLELADRLVERNGADIEVVSGATQTSNRFKALAEEVLKNALEGSYETGILPMDDTYTVEGERNAEGWLPKLTVRIEGGKITQVSFDRVDPQGRSYRKRPDPEARRWDQLVSDLEAQWIQTQDLEKLTVGSDANGPYLLMRGLFRRVQFIRLGR